MQHIFVAPLKQLLTIMLIAGLAGCATFSQDGGFNTVQTITQKHIKQKPVWANTDALLQENAALTSTLLAKPLSQDDAVQVALLNNSGLQADFYQLQIAESNIVQAGRLPNPRFSMLYARNNGDYKIEQVFTMNLMALFTLSKATEIEKQHFVTQQNQIAINILGLARQTRNAYIDALAMQQKLDYLEQVMLSAQASGELASRMHQAGNWSQLQADKEQSFLIENTLVYQQAKYDCIQAKEKLTKLLGLTHPDDFNLPARLSNLPEKQQDLKKISADDFAKRLDLQQTKSNTQALANQLGLTKSTRLINVLELGPARVLEGRRSDPSKKGIEISFELPLFDWGTARVKRAEARYMQALNEAKQQAIIAASEVRQQYDLYTTRYAIAQNYRDQIIPLRKRLLDESLLRYNGMLISPFELMQTAREQVLAVNQYMIALRDFWLAESDLEMALVGSPIASKGDLTQ
ncbi:MAG: TolC family protein [Methylophilaceae bacterium]